MISQVHSFIGDGYVTCTFRLLLKCSYRLLLCQIITPTAMWGLFNYLMRSLLPRLILLMGNHCLPLLSHTVHLRRDLKIDFHQAAHSRKKRQTVTSAYNLIQVVSQPTRVVTNSTGIKSACIDHIFTNAAEMCFKVVSKSVGCSDHNLVAISRKTKGLTWSYNTCCCDSDVMCGV
jgi:hypothetical protein